MRVPTPLFPDPVHLLASLCEEALLRESLHEESQHELHADRSDDGGYGALPYFASAHGSHPVVWVELDTDGFEVGDDAWAIGAVVDGTTQHGDRVVAALVVDIFGREKSLLHHRGEITEVPLMLGEVITDCRDALGLDPAA